MGRDDDIHDDLYHRLNETDGKLSELIGQTSVLVAQNDKLMKLLEKDGARFQKIIYTLFGILLLLIGTVVFGALGPEGFNAVKTIYVTPDKQDSSLQSAGGWSVERNPNQ